MVRKKSTVQHLSPAQCKKRVFVYSNSTVDADVECSLEPLQKQRRVESDYILKLIYNLNLDLTYGQHVFSTLALKIDSSAWAFLVDGSVSIHLQVCPERSFLVCKKKVAGRNVVHESLCDTSEISTPLNMVSASCFLVSISLSQSSVDQVLPNSNICSVHLDIYLKNASVQPPTASIHSIPNQGKTYAYKVKQFLQAFCEYNDPQAIHKSTTDTDSSVLSEKADEFLPMVRSLYSDVQDLHDIQVSKEEEKEWVQNHLIGLIHGTQHPALQCILRPYQTDAVYWMLYKELAVSSKDIPFQQYLLETIFIPIKLNESLDLYFAPHITGFFKELPIIPSCRVGGVLADEMGLGKTVEVISLILCHPNSTWQNESLGEVHTQNRQQDTDIPGTISCICGSNDSRKKTTILHCTVCGLEQHSLCMGFNKNYKLTNDHLKFYRCPTCWTHHKIEGKATLIVSPDAIWKQWQEEIEKHVVPDELKLFVYKGVTGTSSKYIQPHQLASSDVVLTSYSILQREFYLSDHRDDPVSSHQSRRGTRRYLRLSSPLLSVRWWRVCLDEAQMVENVQSQISVMAQRLDAANYWCVSGTPIQKKIDDVQGLFTLLNYWPFTNSFWWKSLLLQPFLASWSTVKKGKDNLDPSTSTTCASTVSSLLPRILSSILWRNTKLRVADQLSLPPLHHRTHWLTLSSVERHLYHQIIEDIHTRLNSFLSDICSTYALSSAENYDQSIDIETQSISLSDVCLSSLTNQEYARLMTLLNRLRRACTHSSLAFESDSVASGLVKGTKECLRMSEVLARMITSRKRQCQELCRTWVFHKNAAAGFFIIQEKYTEAAECYQEVLSTRPYLASYNVEIDSAQQMHILTNLSWIINTKETSNLSSCDTFSILDDSSEAISNNLMEEAAQMQTRFVKRYSEAVAVVHEKLAMCRDEQTSLLENPGELVDWACQVVSQLSKIQVSFTTSLLRRGRFVFELDTFFRLRETLHQHVALMARSWRSPEGNPQETQLLESYSNCCMYARDDPEDQQTTRSDRDSKTETGPDFCPVCAASKALNDLRVTVSMATKDYLGEDGVVNHKVPLMVSLTEVIRETQKRGGTLWSPIAANALPFFTLVKREMALTRRFQSAVAELWAFRHAAMQCARRMQNNSPADDCFVSCEQAVSDVGQAIAEAEVSHSNLERSLHQYAFLIRCSSSNDQDCTDLYCAPCMRHMEPQLPIFVLLQCLHPLCAPCYQIMRRLDLVRRKCPVCRHSFTPADLTKPMFRTYSDQERQSEFGSKIDSVVKCLQDINQADPSAKAIVFSTWPSVLHSLHSALGASGMDHASFMRAIDAAQLSRFRWTEGVAVLLLPLSLGCNGLNLIEANHVLFVDPLLNPGQEAQAVARIHRMGQNRVCEVHRFVVHQTVEEALHSLHSQTPSSSDAIGDEEGWRETREEIRSSLVGTHQRDRIRITLEQFRNLFFDSNNERNSGNASQDLVVNDWGIGHRLG